ncbi:D-arabinitol 2-dehydrogenase-like protein 2 [Elsinoe australis]|uniref:D-arabinitol 2-dehydrogenase-like protein 2 n=1 Tax=Elsinoe australis TaxID=40998 RepID=A0A4U7AZQ9_9PEZI|nr:D-arabinitol 2-dehydrogenase-like protein 2 [Elsinoe australis]
MSPSNRLAKPRLGDPSSAALDLFRLDHQTIAITGGGGAVGLEVARSVLEVGGDVICLDQQKEPLWEPWEKALSAAKRYHTKIWFYQCDITKTDDLKSIFGTAISETRFPLRGLVTCHGLSAGGPSLDFPIDKVRQLMDVNLTGTFACVQMAAKEFQKHDVAGSVVLFASMSAHVCNKGVDTAAYNSSKAAVVQLARSLAGEWGGRQDCPLIRVNTISPGYIRTRQTEDTLKEPGMEEQWSGDSMMNRLSYADEYRGAALYLLSDASSFVTGADLRVDGGHTAW